MGGPVPSPAPRARLLGTVQREPSSGRFRHVGLGVTAIALSLMALGACAARGGSAAHAPSPALCRQMVERQVRCGRTPPAQASVEVDRCVEQGDCWPHIVQPPLVRPLLQCMASAPCQVDCFDAVMTGVPMSPAAQRLEQICLGRGCGSRCALARDLAGASDEILDDVARCFQQHRCGDVEACATGAVLARMLSCK